MRDRVSRARGKLPEDIEEPIIAKQEADAQPIMWIALHSDRYDTLELSRIAERQLKDVLQTVTGVSQIVIGGEKRFAIRIWLDAAKMAARGVTVLDVERALREQNVELPSGRVENLDREMTIQTHGELKTAEQFNGLVIRNDGANLVRLRDIGEARVGAEDVRSIGRFNGRPSVALGVVKQTQANTLEVAEAIKAEMERLKTVIPEGVKIDLPYDESDYVGEAVTKSGSRSSSRSCSSSSSSTSSCAACARRSFRSSRFPCRSSAPSRRSISSATRSTSSRCSRWCWSSASSSMTRSWCWRTSTGTSRKG